MSFWTLSNKIDTDYGKFVCTGGKPRFAIIQLSVIPDNSIKEFQLENKIENLEGANRWFDAAKKGVTSFFKERKDQGRPINRVRVVITDIIWHPVDTTAEVVEDRTKAALLEIFNKNEIEINAEPGA